MTKNPAAVALGTQGGKAKTRKKAHASRLNGLKGGKPHNLKGGRPRKFRLQDNNKNNDTDTK